MLQVGSFEILIDQGVAIILNLDEKSPHANTVSWLEQENERGGKDREVYKKRWNILYTCIELGKSSIDGDFPLSCLTTGG
jgi:hypothetical protein